jgi:hypothetical protein
MPTEEHVQRFREIFGEAGEAVLERVRPLRWASVAGRLLSANARGRALSANWRFGFLVQSSLQAEVRGLCSALSRQTRAIPCRRRPRSRSTATTWRTASRSAASSSIAASAVTTCRPQLRWAIPSSARGS